MKKPFDELRARMSPESRARVAAMTPSQGVDYEAAAAFAEKHLHPAYRGCAGADYDNLARAYLAQQAELETARKFVAGTAVELVALKARVAEVAGEMRKDYASGRATMTLRDWADRLEGKDSAMLKEAE